jgi:hypothetical protein
MDNIRKDATESLLAESLNMTRIVDDMFPSGMSKMKDNINADMVCETPINALHDVDDPSRCICS